MDELETLDPFEKMLAEERRAQEALSSRYKALQSSLERRINLPFDPTLMRVATALLSTGSWSCVVSTTICCSTSWHSGRC